MTQFIFNFLLAASWAIVAGRAEVVWWAEGGGNFEPGISGKRTGPDF